MSLIALDLDAATAGHTATALRYYLCRLEPVRHRVDPAVIRQLEDLKDFFTETGAEGNKGKDEEKGASGPIAGRDHESDEILTQKQAAARLGCSPRTVRNWIANGTLPSVQVGKVNRVSSLDLERFIENR